jgi:hypothetical protein
MCWVLWQNYCQTTQQTIGVLESRLDVKKVELAKISYFKSIVSTDLIVGTTIGGEAYYKINYLQRGERKGSFFTWLAIGCIMLALYSCMLVLV